MTTVLISLCVVSSETTTMNTTLIVMDFFLYATYKTRIMNVATLTLGSQPRQGLAKVRTKSEAQESHFMLSGVWEWREREGMNLHAPK
jgi:hypothetical protein